MSMQVELLHEGRSLKTYHHEGQSFIEAPPSGSYDIRLTNNCGSRRLVVVSVDGVNIVDGSDAGYDGPGYVMRPWETLPIKGWRRSDDKVAKFTFQAQEGSYAARTGRGTKNNGVIGVAVFAEKETPVSAPTWYTIPAGALPPFTTIYASNTDRGMTRSMGGLDESEFLLGAMPMAGAAPAADNTTSSTLESDQPKRYVGLGMASLGSAPRSVARGATTSLNEPQERRTKAGPKSRGTKGGTPNSGILRGRSMPDASPAVDLGTGYGKEVTMHTETTTFERATSLPSEVIVLRYAVRAKLIEMGVPVETVQAGPQAFPASPLSPSVAAPPGWRASR